MKTTPWWFNPVLSLTIGSLWSRLILIRLIVFYNRKSLMRLGFFRVRDMFASVCSLVPYLADIYWPYFTDVVSDTIKSGPSYVCHDWKSLVKGRFYWHYFSEPTCFVVVEWKFLQFLILFILFTPPFYFCFVIHKVIQKLYVKYNLTCKVFLNCINKFFFT